MKALQCLNQFKGILFIANGISLFLENGGARLAQLSKKVDKYHK